MAETRASSQAAHASTDDAGASKTALMTLPRTSLRTSLSNAKGVTDRPREPKVFRFFDLPAEMRNLVYRELLVFNTQLGVSRFPRMKARCHPAILATCHQAYSEANSIMYDENTFSVDLGYVGRFDEELAVNGKPLDLVTLRFLQDKETKWPKFLLKAKALHLTIFVIEGAAYDHSIRDINHALYHLAHFLIESAALTTVHINFEFDDAPSETHLDQLLVSLALMHAEKKVACCETLATKKQDIELFLSSSSRPKPTMSILRKFQRLLVRAKPARARERQVYLDGHDDLAPVGEQVRWGEDLLRSYETMCAETDDKLEVIVSDLERILDECGD